MKKVNKLAFFLVILIIFITSIVNAEDSQTAEKSLAQVESFFSQPVIKYIVGVVFGIWNFGEVTEKLAAGGMKSDAVSGISLIIIYFILWFIFFVAFTDIIKMFSPFSNWVSWILGLGLTIIGAQFKFMYLVGRVLAFIVAPLGAVAVFFEIGLVFLLFILSSFGFSRIGAWARRIREERRAVNAEITARRAGRGMQHAAQVEEALAQGGMGI